ncbi:MULTISPECIES: WhiB family transcriptional regulator [unclassified Streptomyces]|uniref:WhiB family transcriptional regulator n=1 Tax=Streptomyces sp. NBRC 14336 TaxID=3030992 RepID=UPI00331E4274
MSRVTTPAVPEEGSRVWEARAECRQWDAELWFTVRDRAVAVAICAACPVLDHCRAAVLRRERGLPRCRRQGVVAGLTGAQRYELERRAQQLPPRTPAADGNGTAPSRDPAAPCGTRAAYQRHLRRGEPVDEACRAANARSASSYRRTGSTRDRRGTPGPAPPPARNTPAVHRHWSTTCPRRRPVWPPHCAGSSGSATATDSHGTWIPAARNATAGAATPTPTNRS